MYMSHTQYTILVDLLPGLDGTTIYTPNLLYKFAVIRVMCFNYVEFYVGV